MTAPKRKGTDLRDLIAWAKNLGFTCDITPGGHIVFRRPNTQPVYAALSPSCPFARKNTRGDLKRALVESEQRQARRQAELSKE